MKQGCTSCLYMNIKWLTKNCHQSVATTPCLLTRIQPAVKHTLPSSCKKQSLRADDRVNARQPVLLCIRTDDKTEIPSRFDSPTQDLVLTDRIPMCEQSGK